MIRARCTDARKGMGVRGKATPSYVYQGCGRWQRNEGRMNPSSMHGPIVGVRTFTLIYIFDEAFLSHVPSVQAPILLGSSHLKQKSSDCGILQMSQVPTACVRLCCRGLASSLPTAAGSSVRYSRLRWRPLSQARTRPNRNLSFDRPVPLLVLPRANAAIHAPMREPCPAGISFRSPSRVCPSLVVLMSPARRDGRERVLRARMPRNLLARKGALSPPLIARCTALRAPQAR